LLLWDVTIMSQPVGRQRRTAWIVSIGSSAEGPALI